MPEAWPGLPGAGLLALVRLLACFLFLVSASAPAVHAGEASLEASEQDGFGRLVFTFRDTPAADAVVSNGVLVVSFTKPVEADVGVAAQKLTQFVSAARRDPDGMAARFALTRPVKVNVMAAGEKLFVDILPANWKGMPPPLPADVMADLTRRALEAEKVRQELERARGLPPARMTLSAGSNEENIRLTFGFSQPVDVRFVQDGRNGVLTVPAATRFDAAAARAILPPEITAFGAKVAGDALVVRFSVPEGRQMRGREEEEGFVVDIGVPGRRAPAAGIFPDLSAQEVETASGKAPGVTGPRPADQAPDQPAASASSAPPQASGKADAGAHAPEPQSGGDRPSVVTAIPEAAPDSAKGEAIAAVPKRPMVGEAHPVEKAADPVPNSEEVLSLPGVPAKSKTEIENLARSAEARKAVDVHAAEGLLQIAFPFADPPPPAAAFVRGSQLFLVFDGVQDFDVSAVEAAPGGIVGAVRKTATPAGLALEMKLTRPWLASLVQAGRSWVLSLGETILEPVRPLDLRTAFLDDGRTSIAVTMEKVGSLHQIVDHVIGDTLHVVTTRDSAHGVLRNRELIDFAALRSAQGLPVKPYADDVSINVAGGRVVITRPRGLTLTIDPGTVEGGVVAELRPGSPFASDAWRRAKMATRETFSDLERVVASSRVEERTRARVQLARFYLANGDAAEAKGVLDVAERDSVTLHEDPDAMLLRGAALVMLRRFEEASELLDSRELAQIREAALWRMVAEAGLGNIALAREAFREGESVLAAMPPDLQRIFRQTMAEVAIGAQDYATAATQIDALDVMKIEEDQARREVMRGRIAEGFGQTAQALEAYRRAMASDDEIARAQARLYAINLRYATDEIGRPEAVKELEQLTTYWRGDEIEALALARLSNLYKEEGRWRDAFATMRTAVNYHPDASSTRFVQEEMSSEFARLFLSDGPDAAPPTLESVALFYDFKELTPPGRKGDELIRKLADRLVQVDLLTQAADLLTYQVRNRLQGTARAQVAAHVAAIQLMDRKPGQALDILHETRLAGLPEDLVRNRLILEARALSDLQRPDLALEMIAAYAGEEINRLRADIQWAARRWQPAGEGLELVLGDRWKDDKPLDALARQDVLRAAIAYALSGDVLGLDRLRQKFAPKMAGTPDQITFDTVTAPSSAQTPDFARVAAAASVADTFRGFLESYRKRYPESAPAMPLSRDGETKAQTETPSRG